MKIYNLYVFGAEDLGIMDIENGGWYLVFRTNNKVEFEERKEELIAEFEEENVDWDIE